ncbi:response regulator [Thalassotalea aquiviva]|uniref:hybrid sensor histidine kinase/response regulator n=1 Tax=Thalassotalea aquiviva TaxID=3242415 RepID=UPI00352B44AF
MSEPSASTSLYPDKPTILIVDDEPTNIDIASNLLKDGYKIKAATNGELALKIASSGQPLDLILLDVMMPQMDGFEVCKALKQNPQTKSYPVIFLTAKSEINDITQGFLLGAVDYITKPLQPEVLKARVKTHVSLRQSQFALEQQVHTLIENTKLREDIEKLTHHDLKGPLGVILFETPKIPDQQVKQSIEESVNNVLGMINNTLDVFKIENGTYPFNPDMVDLNKLVDASVKAVNTLAKRKNIAFNITSDPPSTYIDAEELLCLSIFNNLVKNAVEASPDNETVYINIRELNDSKVEFCIENTGVVPQELRANLFDKFTSSNHARGSGLGTYSAKLMTEAQNGEINFTVINEKTTQFKVIMPAY